MVERKRDGDQTCDTAGTAFSKIKLASRVIPTETVGPVEHGPATSEPLASGTEQAERWRRIGHKDPAGTVDPNRLRPEEASPDRIDMPIKPQNLQPMVLTIYHHEPIPIERCHGVRTQKLPRRWPQLSYGSHQLPLRREEMHLGVSVAVAYDPLAAGHAGHICRVPEWSTGRMSRSYRSNKLAGRSVATQFVGVAIHNHDLAAGRIAEEHVRVGDLRTPPADTLPRRTQCDDGVRGIAQQRVATAQSQNTTIHVYRHIRNSTQPCRQMPKRAFDAIHLVREPHSQLFPISYRWLRSLHV